jgi:hypothetical protein
MSAVVLNITGKSGIGKTILLQKYQQENPGALQILTPTTSGQVFDCKAVDWDHHAAIAIDELWKWDRGSLVAGVTQLEQIATSRGQKLILVSQSEEELNDRGIKLAAEPALFRVKQDMRALVLSYESGVLHFPLTSTMFNRSYLKQFAPTPEQLRVYRQQTGCSVFEAHQALRKVALKQATDKAANLEDLRAVVAELVEPTPGPRG